jgi:hypothetical protein
MLDVIACTCARSSAKLPTGSCVEFLAVDVLSCTAPGEDAALLKGDGVIAANLRAPGDVVLDVLRDIALSSVPRGEELPSNVRAKYVSAAREATGDVVPARLVGVVVRTSDAAGFVASSACLPVANEPRDATGDDDPCRTFASRNVREATGDDDPARAIGVAARTSDAIALCADTAAARVIACRVEVVCDTALASALFGNFE